MSLDIAAINKDKHLFMIDGLPLITVYDDNFFVRNDYDVLSIGQRNYLIEYFSKLGLQQTSGKTLQNNDITLHIPKPNSNLAVSSFDQQFLSHNGRTFYCVTPTMFAEALFHLTLGEPPKEVVKTLRRLIKKCPFNIEWLRDVSYHSPIQEITKRTYTDLIEYQAFVVNKRYKSKKAL